MSLIISNADNKRITIKYTFIKLWIFAGGKCNGYCHCIQVCFVSQIWSLINVLCVWHQQLGSQFLCRELLLSLVSSISLCPRCSSAVCWGAALSHGNPENAFVTLNPCSVSADDIIVWEHITSPLPRLSLLKTALPGVYWAICTHVHTCKHAHKLLARL